MPYHPLRKAVTSQPPPRKRSAAVSLGLVSVLAISLTGCTTGKTVTRRCVAENDFTVATNDLCLAPTPVPGSANSSQRYRWYYGGRVTDGRVTGGSFNVPSNRSTIRTSSSYGTSSGGNSSATTSGVKSGGFGASAKSSSGS